MKRAIIFAIVFGATQPAMAQGSGLSDMAIGNLRPEVQRRYDEALAATTSPEILSSLSSAHIWASEAKVQCGIALGFLKSNIRDQDSLSKCDRFHAMITQAPPPPAPVSPPPAPTSYVNTVCDTPFLATLFFDWDSAIPSGDADQTIAFIMTNRGDCGRSRYNVVGHTDRSGSDAYNNKLSAARASAIADKMATAGIDRSTVITSARGESEPKVDTPDGERNPTNRRVEISAN